MRVSLKSVLCAGLVLGAMTFSASAALTTITSTVDQSGYLGPQNLATYPLTGVTTPYDFTSAGSLTSITDITVTLTSINDGDTATGNFDFGNLFLGLNGINTGIALNGLPDGQASSITVGSNGSLSPATATALLAALQANPKLIGTIIDTTPTNGPTGDILGIPAAVQTTLSITGEGGTTVVPLPAAIFIAPLGAGVAGIYSRRFRKAK